MPSKDVTFIDDTDASVKVLFVSSPPCRNTVCKSPLELAKVINAFESNPLEYITIVFVEILLTELISLLPKFKLFTTLIGVVPAILL